MKILRLTATTIAFCLLPAVAFGAVTFKNAEKKSVELSIKRAHSTQTTAVPGGISMEIPGPPMKITVKVKTKKGEDAPSIDADDGDTITWQKGKLTKVAADTDMGTDDSGAGDSGDSGDSGE